MERRTLWLVAYDVRSPARLREVHEVVKGWSTGGQRSVHECWLGSGELWRLRRELVAAIDTREDSLVLITPDPSRPVQALGIARRPADPRFFVIG